jgi:hypothetical protein
MKVKNILFLALSVLFLFNKATAQGKYKHPISYENRGAGDDPNSSIIKINSGKKESAISDAIRCAFQAANLAVNDNSVDDLKQSQLYSSSTINLTNAQISDYNKANASMTNFLLLTGRNYRFHYTVKYKIREESLEVIINWSVILEYQGLGSETWHKYKEDYKSNYFTDIVDKEFTKRLRNSPI